MKKSFIGIILIGVSVLWFKGFVQRGDFEKYLDRHPMPINARLEYYWALFSASANHPLSARYRFNRVREKYPESEYAPLAWAELISLLDEEGKRNEVLEESGKFLEKFPEHPKGKLIRNKISLIQNGY